MRGLPWLLWLAVGLGLSCNPYDPNLGETPFLCGLSDPKCPDGYTAVDVSVGRCVCQLHPPSIDAGAAYACTEEDVGTRNEVVDHATQVDLDLNPTLTIPNVAICPANDVDVYRIPIRQPNTLITVTVNFDRTRRAPSLDILDRDGASLHRPPVGELGMRRVSYLAEMAGDYFAEVKGTESVTYAITFERTGQ